MRAPTSILPLQLRKVSFAAGGRAIIDGVSFELGSSLRTVILGANGAGKSVLLRLMHGLLRPTAGEVVWSEPDPERLRRRQAMVFQRPVMLRRSALANLEYALELGGVPREERRGRARKALEDVGLAHLAASPARVLSGGEQQRLALARAWSLRPQVLFLDEPTASLDPTARNAIEAAIEAIHAEGTKIVLVTHSLGQARRLGDEVLFIHQGRLFERTGAGLFFRQPASPEAAAFIKGELPWV